MDTLTDVLLFMGASLGILIGVFCLGIAVCFLLFIAGGIQDWWTRRTSDYSPTKLT